LAVGKAFAQRLSEEDLKRFFDEIERDGEKEIEAERGK
jgi:hypothetical protein